ncbi:hypothetical protein A2U01_0082466, partial [Trifolium medium]|nr:hypothetical protein [Trifolium medium]
KAKTSYYKALNDKKGKGQDRVSPMTARKEVMVAVEGSKAMDYAISVARGVICHMITRRKATSVLVVASLGTRPMLVV